MRERKPITTEYNLSVNEYFEALEKLEKIERDWKKQMELVWNAKMNMLRLDKEATEQTLGSFGVDNPDPTVKDIK